MDICPLSEQERSVVTLIWSGMTLTEVADAMGISIKTVSTYWMRVRDKLNVGLTNTQCVRTQVGVCHYMLLKGWLSV